MIKKLTPSIGPLEDKGHNPVSETSRFQQKPGRWIMSRTIILIFFLMFYNLAEYLEENTAKNDIWFVHSWERLRATKSILKPP
jgi:hypothetical protein